MKSLLFLVIILISAQNLLANTGRISHGHGRGRVRQPVLCPQVQVYHPHTVYSPSWRLDYYRFQTPVWDRNWYSIYQPYSPYRFQSPFLDGGYRNYIPYTPRQRVGGWRSSAPKKSLLDAEVIPGKIIKNPFYKPRKAK